MHELKGKTLYLIFIAFLVVVIMFSNLGQNFKTDIFSYNSIVSYSNTLANSWYKAKHNQDYISSSSNYIISFLKNNNVKPVFDNRYDENWSISVPYFKYHSSLEIISRYGRIIKKYEYGKDFTEDFKGLISSGILKGKASFIEDMENDKDINDIVLFNGYQNKTSDNIMPIDLKLKEKGVLGVISPGHSQDLTYESGLYDSNLKTSDKGLAKIIVSPSTFNELKKFSKRGYSIKMKSGAEVETTNYKNIYGIINGKNNMYKPLVFVVFYDGIYKTFNSSVSDFQDYTVTPSILMECINGIYSQRLSKPDRPIIFAFLSGYMHNKEGLNVLLKKNLDGDIVILDGLGSSSRKILSYTRVSRTLCATIEHFIKKNNFEIISKNFDSQSNLSLVYVSNNDYEKHEPLEFQRMYDSYKFLLSLAGDECYNLDFLSGNIREVRTFKRFIRDNSAILSLITILLLIIIVFRDPGNRNYN